MTVQMNPKWQAALATEWKQPYFKQLRETVRSLYLTDTIYPESKNIFRAFDLTPLPCVRVVILGQDPYHGPGQAQGLAFSVPEDMPIPPSLQNIYKEIESDTGVPSCTSGDLTAWATQGVLLLNSTLTVRAGCAGSHRDLGWEPFTNRVIEVISAEQEHVVFMLWGTFAYAKQKLIDEEKHLVLSAPHPSPLSAYRGFFGCRHFSQCNQYLIQIGQKPISW